MHPNDSAETTEALVLRLVDENGWEWRTVVKVVNRFFHTDYSIEDLKHLYKKAKTPTSRRSEVFHG